MKHGPMQTTDPEFPYHYADADDQVFDGRSQAATPEMLQTEYPGESPAHAPKVAVDGVVRVVEHAARGLIGVTHTLNVVQSTRIVNAHRGRKAITVVNLASDFCQLGGQQLSGITDGGRLGAGASITLDYWGDLHLYPNSIPAGGFVVTIFALHEDGDG